MNNLSIKPIKPKKEKTEAEIQEELKEQMFRNEDRQDQNSNK